MLVSTSAVSSGFKFQSAEVFLMHVRWLAHTALSADLNYTSYSWVAVYVPKGVGATNDIKTATKALYYMIHYRFIRLFDGKLYQCHGNGRFIIRIQ